MPNSRSWNRRESSVTQAGFFTVLKPNGWFSALRLPGGFRYRIGGRPEDQSVLKPTSASKPETPARPGGQATSIPLQIVSPSEQGPSLIRVALIALAAAAITLSFFWFLYLEDHP